MKSTNRLWRWLGLICVLSFGALGYLGWQIYLTAPPIPKSVITTDGEVLFTGAQIQRGQQAWLAAGGQQLGTVWGHGSYVAPDWSADWLHRESVALQGIRSAEQRKATPAMTQADKAAVDARVREEMRRNTYDDINQTVKVSAERAQAIRAVARHYDDLFGTEPSLATQGLWYARSAEFVHSPLMETFVWLRVPGDIVFAAGSALLAAYAWKLLRPTRSSPIPIGAVQAGAKR